MKIVAVIPVRAGSKRVPNKNIRPFGDSNLLVRKIRQLKTIDMIDEIVVSSDSSLMLDMAKKEGVSIHNRPIEYCDEKSKTFNEVVEYISSNISGDILIWAPCVCPFVSSDHINLAIREFINRCIDKQINDSVVSSRLFKEYLFNDNGPCNFDIDHHVKSQDLPDWNIIVNGFFIAKRENFIKWRFVYGKNPFLFPLSKLESLDIDDIVDFKICESLLEYKNNE